MSSTWDTCTPQTCSLDESIFHYVPSLGANAAFLALFGLFILTHLALAFRWRTWSFTICVILGCTTEMIGYGGRIKMHHNVFDFTGFIMQIVCITIAPVFFSAAIYITLYDAICTLHPTLARFKPNWYYIWFIVCDVISLVLQSIGGALSSESNGSSQSGEDIALAGLSFQVFTLTVFIALALDYAYRYHKASARGVAATIPVGRSPRFRLFLVGWSLATICVFIRCCYRVAELSQGYGGPLLKKQNLFIGLEGVTIVLAVVFLHIGHPGIGLRRLPAAPDVEQKYVSGSEGSAVQKTDA